MFKIIIILSKYYYMDTSETNTLDENNDIDENETNLNLDYMKALLIFLESEYNIQSNDPLMVRQLFNFLIEMDISIDQIKRAIILLYESEHPDIIGEINRMLNILVMTTTMNSNMSNLFSIINNANDTMLPIENIDQYTGDIINPGDIMNQINQNINNIPDNLLNMALIVNYPRILDLPHYNTHIFSFIPITPDYEPEIIHHVSGKETLNKIMLDKCAMVDTFKNLDEKLKKFDTCLICLDEFKEENIIRKINCDHIFHKECIDSWLLNESYKCPLCRNSVIVKNNENMNKPDGI